MKIAMLPAQDGDCLFVEANGFRLLIDGGRADTGAARLGPFLRKLPARAGRPTVDLAVLTHIDADHIEGLLALLTEPCGVRFGGVWFNGAAHHLAATGAFAPRGRRADGSASRDEAAILGVNQALRFSRAIETAGVAWNEEFRGGPVMVETTADLPRIPLAEGVDIVLLGPPRQKLADLYPDWVAGMPEGDRSGVMAARPRTRPTVANLRDLAAELDIADRTRPNGGSIAFVVEAGRKRALFTGDAHPDDLAASIKRYGGPGPVAFDAVKAPHHGSARNNTSVLLAQLRSGRWLLSADGSRHSHPDEEAVARIVLSPETGKTLFFNYRSARSAAWDDPALRSHFGYDAVYGDGESPVTLEL